MMTNDFNNTENDSTKSRNENRFTFEDEELSFGIKDNGKLISVKDLLKIANHLNNENQQLKAELSENCCWNCKHLKEINEFLISCECVGDCIDAEYDCEHFEMRDQE